MEEKERLEDFEENSMHLGCENKDIDEETMFENVKIKVEEVHTEDDHNSNQESQFGKEICCYLPHSEKKENSQCDEVDSGVHTAECDISPGDCERLVSEEPDPDIDNDGGQGKDTSKQKKSNRTQEPDNEVVTANTKFVTFRFKYRKAETKVPKVKETAGSATLKAVGQLLEQRGLSVPSLYHGENIVPEPRYVIKSVVGCLDESIEDVSDSVGSTKVNTKRSVRSRKSAISRAKSTSVESVRDMLNEKKSSNSVDVSVSGSRSTTESSSVDYDDSEKERRNSCEQTGTECKTNDQVISKVKRSMLSRSEKQNCGEVKGKSTFKKRKVKNADVSEIEQADISGEQTSNEEGKGAKGKKSKRVKGADVSEPECEQGGIGFKEKAIIKPEKKTKRMNTSKAGQTIKSEPEEMISIGQTDPPISSTKVAPDHRMIFPKQTVAIENVTPMVLPNNLQSLQNVPVKEFIPGSQFVPYYFVVQGNEELTNLMNSQVSNLSGVIVPPDTQQGLTTVSSSGNLAQTKVSEGLQSAVKTKVITMFPPSQTAASGPSLGSNSTKADLSIVKQELITTISTETASQPLTSPALTSGVSSRVKGNLITPMTSKVETNVATVSPHSQNLRVQNPERNTFAKSIAHSSTSQGLQSSSVNTNKVTMSRPSHNVALHTPANDLCKGPNSIFSDTTSRTNLHVIGAQVVQKGCKANPTTKNHSQTLISPSWTTPMAPALQTNIITVFPSSQSLMVQSPANDLCKGPSTIFSGTSSKITHVVGTHVQPGLVKESPLDHLTKMPPSTDLASGVSSGMDFISPVKLEVHTTNASKVLQQNLRFPSQDVGPIQKNGSVFSGALSVTKSPGGVSPIVVNRTLTPTASLVTKPDVNHTNKHLNGENSISDVPESQQGSTLCQSASRNTFSLLGVTHSNEKIHIVPEVRTVNNASKAPVSANVDVSTRDVNSSNNLDKREKAAAQCPEPRNIYHLQIASQDVLAQNMQDPISSVPAADKASQGLMDSKGSCAVKQKVKKTRKKKIYHMHAHFPEVEDSQFNIAALAQKDGLVSRSVEEEKITIPFSSVEEITPLLGSNEIKKEPDLEVFPVCLVRSYLPAGVKPSSGQEDHAYSTTSKLRTNNNSKCKPKGKKRVKVSESVENVSVKQEVAQLGLKCDESGENSLQVETIPEQSQEESEFEDSWNSSDDEYVKKKQMKGDSDASYNPGESESEASEVVLSDESEVEEREQKCSNQKEVYVAVGQTQFKFKQVYSLLIEEKGEEEFVCKNCGESVESKQEALTHMLVHRPYKCLPCNETFPSSNTMRIHMKSHVVQFCCTHCPFSTCVEKELNEHTKSEHEPSESEPYHTWVCHICGNVSTQLRSAQSHMRLVHDSNNEKREGDIECPICKHVCISLRVFRSHMLAHLGKFLDCPEEGCTYRTTTKETLKNHFYNVHRVRTVVCPFEGCGVKLRHEKNLDDHLNMVHYKIRKYKCTYCNKGFLATKHLLVHLRIHSDIKPLACEHCDYRCRQRAALNWHMKKKHPDKDSGKTVKKSIWFTNKPGRKATKSESKKKSNCNTKNDVVNGGDGHSGKEKRGRSKRKKKSYSEESDKDEENSEPKPRSVRQPRPQRKSKMKKSYSSEQDEEKTGENKPVAKEKRRHEKRKKTLYSEESDTEEEDNCSDSESVKQPRRKRKSVNQASYIEQTL